ncbi:MAG: hypothetical protein V4726_07950 [Verrucomicrobiota bacterium]
MKAEPSITARRTFLKSGLAAAVTAPVFTLSASADDNPAPSEVRSGPIYSNGPIYINLSGPDLDPRINLFSHNLVAGGFNSNIYKTAGCVLDLNMESGAIVYHDADYLNTPMYGGEAGGGIFQVYAEAGSEGLAMGCNSFTGMNRETYYAIPEIWVSSGHVRIENGPIMPASEIARWNNGESYLQGFHSVIEFDAEQTGDIVTCISGNVFLPVMVGRYLAWSTAANGKRSCVDRIIEFLSPTQIRVERSRSISSQRARYGFYGFEVSRAGVMQQTGPNAMRVLDAHNGGDIGGGRSREFIRGALTVDSTPAIMTTPQVLGDYIQFWEITVTALCDNPPSYAVLRRTVETFHVRGIHQIGTPLVVGSDIIGSDITGAWRFSVDLSFANHQLSVTVMGPVGRTAVWTAAFRVVESAML